MLDPMALPLWVYVAIGCVILWAKMKATQRAVYGLTDVIALFVPETWPRLRAVLELVIYLMLGSLIVLSQKISVDSC
jgi:hypothetical protein